MAKHKPIILFTDLFAVVAGKIHPPIALVLGSPNEAADICAVLGAAETTCYQMDLYQSGRLQEESEGHWKNEGSFATEAVWLAH